MHLFENAWLIESLNQLKYIIYEVKHALFYSECLLDIWILQNRLIFLYYVIWNIFQWNDHW